MGNLETIATRMRWAASLVPALLAAALGFGCASSGRAVEDPVSSTLEAPVERVVDDLLGLAERRADTSGMRVQLAAIEPALADGDRRTFVGDEPWPTARVQPRERAPRMQRELHHELTLLLAQRLHLIDAPLTPSEEADPAWIEQAVERHGATHVLLGDLEERGQTLVLSLRLVDARSGLIVAAARGPIPPESFSDSPGGPTPIPASSPAVLPYSTPTSGHRIAGRSALATDPEASSAREPARRSGAADAPSAVSGLARDPATGLLLPAYVPESRPEPRFGEPRAGSAGATEALEALEQRSAASSEASAIPPLSAEETSPPPPGAADLFAPLEGARSPRPDESQPAATAAPGPRFRSSPQPDDERPEWVRDVVRRYGPGGDHYEESRELERGSSPPPAPREPETPRGSTPAPASTPPAEEAPPWIRELIERYRASGPRSGRGEG